MSEYKPITGELRGMLADINWTEIIDHMQTSSGAVVDGDWLDHWHEHTEHICDQIDSIHAALEAEHEKAMIRAGQLLDDAEKERDYNYANWQECKQKVLQHNITIDELDARIECLEDELSHCIEQPKDADGEHICAGDKLDGYGKTIEVVELRYGRSGWVLISRDGNAYADTFAFSHHRPDTWERIIEDAIGDRIKDDGEFNETINALVARCKALAGDAE